MGAPHHARDQTRAVSGAASGRHPTVLVVEDSEVIRRIMSLVLTAEGYQVIESADGFGVVELAREHRPDIITLDLALPGVDGREILRRLNQDAVLREVPVVVVSAFADSLSISDRQQAADVILKPFDLDDLVERLELAISTRAG